MELPQPRPFGTEGKNPTHDFLSLYSYSSFQHQDPRPSPGIYLKTHDFLQPLEKVGKNSAAKGENKDETSAVEKLPTSSVEQTLPGGIGTYTISHISNFNQRAPKPERTVYTIAQAASTERNGEVSKANSSCSSYSGGSFTLWGESMVKEKGASTVKENAGERHVVREPAEKLGRWSSERPLQAPFNNRSNFTSQSSSKQSGQKNQTFMEMMRSAKVHQEEEEDDDEDFVVKRDGSSQKGDLTVKVDEKSTDQKAITPRSKHSATEQRRRSKINDRFQILRDLIPHSDQKRDKASFLLEVIEYIQFLQEKVNKYEALYPGWNQEPTKLTPWRNNHGPGESMIDHSGALKNGPSPGLMFSGRFDDNNIAVTPTILPNIQNPVESDMSTGAAYKAMDNHPGLSNKSVPLPIPLQPNTFTPVGKSSGLAEPQRPISDAEDMSSHPQSQFWQNKPCTTTSDTPNDQEELLIEGGTINISSVYSQGLLNTLTQALQSSGVDLSQASISMQIDLGKRAISRLNTITSSAKDHGDPSSSNRATAHSRVVSSGEDSDQAQKRLKTEKS